MKYGAFINSIIKEKIAEADNLVAFGQNIDAGSCLGGLTRGLKAKPGSRILNTINAENTLCGFGFGLLMRGARAVFFMKQLDFLLLGLDHLVNTWNIIRNTELKDKEGSFTIMPIIVDSGYQGPQSSFNNFADMCSLARIPGFAITNAQDARKILDAELLAPGFRVLGVSLRLFGEEVIDPGEPLYANPENTVFQYSAGKDLTIVSFNFAFPQSFGLKEELKAHGAEADLFSVNAMTPTAWEAIVASAEKTGRLLIIDDSKSENLPGFALLADCAGKVKKQMVLKRQMGEDWLNPVSDKMEVDSGEVLKWLQS